MKIQFFFSEILFEISILPFCKLINFIDQLKERRNETQPINDMVDLSKQKQRRRQISDQIHKNILEVKKLNF